jgi:ankyrin repeat protein
MSDAKTIAEEANATINSNPVLLSEISKEKQDQSGFFQYFIEKVKANDFLVVSYILNYCFDNAEARAKFGNKRDGLGNTAYHYAAQYGHNNIIVILNDKRAFKGKQEFFKFKEYNDKSQTPFDLCCLAGRLPTFQLMWARIGKSNHNPTHSLLNGCIGGNTEIVAAILQHPKCDLSNDNLKPVLERALAGEFGDAIKEQFEAVNQPSNNNASSP